MFFCFFLIIIIKIIMKEHCEKYVICENIFKLTNQKEIRRFDKKEYLLH
jgi:hypothetical protein